MKWGYLVKLFDDFAFLTVFLWKKFGGFGIVVYLCGVVFKEVSLYNIPFKLNNTYEEVFTFGCYALHGIVRAS